MRRINFLSFLRTGAEFRNQHATEKRQKQEQDMSTIEDVICVGALASALFPDHCAREGSAVIIPRGSGRGTRLLGKQNTRLIHFLYLLLC